MSEERIIERRNFDYGFCFVSHGVAVKIASDDQVMLGKARELVDSAFGGLARIFEESKFIAQCEFGIEDTKGIYRLYKNGFETTAGNSERNFYKYLNSMLRLEVAEHAEGMVFVHAGVVGWKGSAIVFPGTSFAGKSTLAAELIKNGAEYYSDEYAVIGPDGLIAPFPRHISMRYFGGTRESEVPISKFGGRVGEFEIPVGLLLFTSFEKGAEWKPKYLSAGQAIMEMIPHTLSMRKDPSFCLKVLDLVARRAIIVAGPRGDVRKFAKFLLEYFDNHSILTKMT